MWPAGPPGLGAIDDADHDDDDDADADNDTDDDDDHDAKPMPESRAKSKSNQHWSSWSAATSWRSRRDRSCGGGAASSRPRGGTTAWATRVAVCSHHPWPAA